MLACDFVIATPEASISLPEPKRGITAALVTPLLSYRLGAGRAGQLLLSGEPMSAETAQQAGLYYDLVDVDQLPARAARLIQQCLTCSPSALAMTKQHLLKCAGSRLQQQLDDSIKVSASARETADAREGLAAFLEKRKPRWDISR